MSIQVPPGSPAEKIVDPSSDLTAAGRRILQAARAIVVESGLTALSLRAVAARADVHTSAIGYHFGNKQGLVDALIESLRWEGEEEMQEALDMPPGRERLHAYMEYYKAFATNEDYWRLLLALVPATNNEASAFPEAMRQMYTHDQILLDLPHGDVTPVRSQVLIDFIFATIEGVAIQFILNARDLDVSACFDLLEAAVTPLYLELLDGSESAVADFSPEANVIGS